MTRRISILFICAGLFFVSATPAFSFWIWSPKDKTIINPKHTVAHSPDEQFTYALDLYNNKKLELAIREFNNLLRSYPKAKEAAEAQYYLGRAYEDIGKLYNAYQNYQKVIDKYPFSERLNEIVEREYAVAEKFLDSFLSRKANVIWQEIAGREYAPVEILRSVVSNDPYGQYAPISQYKIGVFLRKIGQLDAAILEFQKVIDDYSQSEWAEAARYQIALSQADMSLKSDYDQETTKDAIKEFEEFIETHPDLDLADDAEEQITRLQDKEIESTFHAAEFYERQKQFKSAIIYYQYVVDKFPRSSWAEKAVEKLDELRRKTR